MPEPDTGIPVEKELDVELKRQLEAIRREEVPERLLDLARRLQTLLRDRSG
jgi:hypothetical protein